ncbi:hypothetical protein [Shewanella sp. UCD-KL21]|uniref:hypothetical protein n=1 Tax=Shewanella sp. UCD-KL21 TaxID=1917164 RepID=UPI00097042EC|nr:hypothetical protein [Shewanella sp. UCD-KL21]
MTFFSKVDLFFTRVVAWLIHMVGYAFIALIGMTSIVLFPFSFFEYSEGLADLDLLEISLIALFFGALWRFVKKTRDCGESYWAATKKICILLTLASLFLGFIEYCFFYFLLQEQGNLTFAYFENSNDWILLFNSVVLIVTLYGLVPTETQRQVGITDDENFAAVGTPEETDIESDSNTELKPNGI